MTTKRILFIIPLFCCELLYAQDTTKGNGVEDAWLNYVNTIDVNESELDESGSTAPSSLLLSGRNYFLNVYGFSFFHVRYRQRGYENFPGRTYVNGVPVNSLENNSVQYGLYSGLNNVFRVVETSEQIAASNFTFGGLGNHFSMSTSPSNQRGKFKVGYTFSNRNYQHRISAVYNNGFDAKGWNYTIAANMRYSKDGYFPGTYYNGFAGLISVEKKFKRNSLSFSLWGSDYETGRQTAAVEETFTLTNDNFYNPLWGYQNEKKRNASVGKNFLPTATLNYKANYNDKLYWNSAVGATVGKTQFGGLEWYNAPDPRPDYYRYLPSFFKNDNTQYNELTTAIKNDPPLLQVNWDKLYQVNLSQKDGRALYALGSRTTQHLQLSAASFINAILNRQLTLCAGLEWQYAKLRYYKTMNDLLGAQYWLNVNAFIERDNPSDITTIQNNLGKPNEKIKIGDKYSYDYAFQIQRISQWAELQWKTSKWDVFGGVEVNARQLNRIGNVQNGLFPNNSFGKDPTRTDLLVNGKLGTIYKIDGRKYAFLNVAMMEQPANPNNIYVSSSTRNFRNDSVGASKIITVEGGFVFNAPSLRFRANAYYSNIRHASEFRYFYDDVHQSFAAYHLNDIAKKYYGVEFAFDWKFLPNWNYAFVSNMSRSLYDNQPQLIVTSETNVSLLTNEKVYLKNYRVANTPQTIMHHSVGFRNGVYFFNMSANAFFDRWAAINPMRRSVSILQDINPIAQKDLLDGLLQQEKLANGCTLDFFGGYSFLLQRKHYRKTRMYIDLMLSGNNLLNNKTIVGYAFEQMRIDMKDYDLNKFPNKYGYAMGRNYSVNIALRF